MPPAQAMSASVSARSRAANGPTPSSFATYRESGAPRYGWTRIGTRDLHVDGESVCSLRRRADAVPVALLVPLGYDVHDLHLLLGSWFTRLSFRPLPYEQRLDLRAPCRTPNRDLSENRRVNASRRWRSRICLAQSPPRAERLRASGNPCDGLSAMSSTLSRRAFVRTPPPRWSMTAFFFFLRRGPRSRSRQPGGADPRLTAQPPP